MNCELCNNTSYTRMPLKWTCQMRSKYIGRKGFKQFEPFETFTMINVCLSCAPNVTTIHSVGWDYWDAFDDDLKKYITHYNIDDWNALDTKDVSNINVCQNKGVKNLVKYFETK